MAPIQSRYGSVLGKCLLNYQCYMSDLVAY